MSEKRLELKVGIFVLIGLVLIGALMLYFSKGQSFFKPTYTLFMRTSNVGGLKTQAKVMLSGVEVGVVEEITLSPEGTNATVKLSMLKRYTIHRDAVFAIDALGFLGDQYVAVRPKTNQAPPLRDGDEVIAEQPFDLQELARASLGFVNRIDTTAQHLNQAILRVDRMVLNEQTLGNIAAAVSNFMAVSERAIATVDQIGSLFQTNAVPLNQTITNMVIFSDELNELARGLNRTLVTNQTAVTRAIDNLDKTTFTVRELVTDLQAGKGIAGSLLSDEQLKLEMSRIITNLSTVSSNLTVLSSNINSKGLWRVLWKPKSPKPAKEPEPPASRFSFPGRR